MSELRNTIEIARQTAVLLFRDRLYWLLWLAMAGGGVLVLAMGYEVGARINGPVLFAASTWWMLGTVTIPWTTSYLAVQAVHGDVEDRTFQYLFVRPVARSSILLGKFLAAFGLSLLAHTAGALAMFAGAAFHEDRWPDGLDFGLVLYMLAALAMLAVGYGAVACFFASRFRRPLVWSAAFVMFAGVFLPLLPAKAGIRVVTIADPVRRFLLDRLDPDPRFVRALWPSERAWTEDMVGTPLTNVATVLGVALLLALVSYCRAEYDSRERE